MDLIRSAALPLKAASRLISGKLSADDPKQPFESKWSDQMFSQVAIVVLGIFLVAMGLRDGNYLNVGVGILVAAFAVSTLYKLKSGK